MFNGFMLDAARCLDKHQYYHRAIEFAAERGMDTLLWHFTDDQGCALQFECLPDIASPHAFSRAEMRSLVAFANERGVRLIPELASLGHTAYLTRLPRFRHLAESDQMFSCICPVAPETRPLIASLLEETCEVFDSPIIHAGLDESNYGHHPLTKAAIEARGRTDIFADHILFVHEQLTQLGRQMWMWADGLWHDRALADRLPRDIVQCNWRYRPQEPVATTQHLIDHGFDVVLCSASISSQQTLFPGEQFAFQNLRSVHAHESLVPLAGVAKPGKVIGRINTIWTPVRFISESMWLGLDLVFALMREGPNVDLNARIEAFGSEFYGLDDVAAWREACRIVLEQSPTRDDWLGVITMMPVDAARATAAARQWCVAAEKLQHVRPQVRRREREFDAFLLMVRLAQSAFTLASRAAEMTPDAAAHAVGQWQAMIDAIDQQWDVERFADDPRKYAAPIDHYAGDHLIPMMRRGLARLRELSTTIVAEALS